MKPRALPDVEFALADRVDFLDGAAWDRVTAEATWWLGRPALRAVETAGPATLRTRYALAYRNGSPVAAVAVQSVDVDGSRIGRPEAGGRLGRAARAVRARVLRGLNFRVHACANLVCGGRPAVAIAPGEDADSVWPAIGRALNRLQPAGSRIDLTLLGDFPTGASSAPTALRTLGYRPVPTEPDMILPIPARWKTYDDYLGSLAGKPRKTALKYRSDLAAAGCRFETIRPADRAADLDRLYLEVHSHARWRLVTAAPGWLPAVAAAAGDAFRCTAILRGNEMLGFVTTLRDREQAIGYQVGYAKMASAGLPVYLALLHAVIADGIALGARSISFGRTALEPKARLGARPVPLTVWVRAANPAVQAIVRPLVKAIRAPIAPLHQPFKESADTPPTA